MIPEVGKTYKIDYWFQIQDESDREQFYKGPAKCLEAGGETDDGEELWYFELMDGDGGKAYFGEEDVVEEIVD